MTTRPIDPKPSSDASESARLARADARRERGVAIERIASFDEHAPVADASIASRFALTASLTRAAFRMSGRPLVVLPRAEWPGEIFRIDADSERRPT